MTGCQWRKRPDPLPCGEQGRIFRGACLHEHVTDFEMCDTHHAMGNNWICAPCQDADGHQCRIVLVLLEAGHA